MPTKCRPLVSVIISAILMLLACIPSLSLAGTDPADWGIHKIWGSYAVDSMPQVRGGYITPEWIDVNPAPGEFDFTEIDNALERYASLGKPLTVAIRGSFKPDFLFDEVPYHPQRLGLGVHDEKGSLQYWHPTYMQRYKELLTAFNNHLRASPNRDSVYSIRLNLNALGTEHSGVEERYRPQNQWTIPPGVTFVPYSDTVNEEYKRFVAQSYYDLLVPDFLVFVRTIVLISDDNNLPAVVENAIEQGTMGLVHTSSLPEPTSRSTERKYLKHIEFGRQGDTPVYAEPYSSSTKGSRGEQPPPQWNYWRILSDLHAGVTFISVYGSDLERHVDAEYDAAFEFGNRYAGFQTRSAAEFSPGAWVALREGDQYLLGDYTFLMSRMSGDANDVLETVGPDWQRHGAWARRVPAGGLMRFQVEDRLARHIESENIRLRITYFNSGNPKFGIEVPGSASQTIDGGGSGVWRTVEVDVPAAGMSGNQGADITIRAITSVTLHMVEIVRADVALPPVDRTTVSPKPVSGFSGQ